jgi:hypothetical protein
VFSKFTTGMILTEWEIWYTYSTYLTGGVEDLTSAAKALVESGLAYCAMHRDGETYWKSNAGVRCGLTEIEPNEKGNSATVRLKPFGSPEPDFASFSMEAWFQSAWLRYAEIRLFGEDFSAPAPYVRAFLGQCELINDDGNVSRRVTCYPNKWRKGKRRLPTRNPAPLVVAQTKKECWSADFIA